MATYNYNKTLTPLQKAALREREEEEKRAQQNTTSNSFYKDFTNSARANTNKIVTTPLQKAALREREEEEKRTQQNTITARKEGQKAGITASRNATNAGITSSDFSGTNYLETARNATQKTVDTGNTLTADEKQRRTDELNTQLDTLRKQLATAKQKSLGYTRGNYSAGLKEVKAEIASINEQMKEIEKEIETVNTDRYISPLTQKELANKEAEEEDRAAYAKISKYSGSAGGRELAYKLRAEQLAKEAEKAGKTASSQSGDKVEDTTALYKDYAEKMRTAEATQRELDMIDYVNKLNDKNYTEKSDISDYEENIYSDRGYNPQKKASENDTWSNFSNQTRANYTYSRISIDSNMAWDKYLSDPTESNKEYALALTQLEREFADKYSDVLDDEGVVASWISQSAAQYMPQFIDQLKYQGVGAAGGALVGAAVAQPVQGAKIGASIGSAKYSYSTMRGAAFKSLIEAGVDEETAAEAAHDEAFISSLIEGGETYLSWMLLGGTKALSAIGGASKTAVAGGTANTATKLIAKMFGDTATSTLAKGAVKEVAGTATNKVMSALTSTAVRTGLGYAGNVLSESAEEWLQQGVSIANERRTESGNTGIGNLLSETFKVYGDVITGKDTESASEMWESAKEGGKIAIMFGGASLAANTVIANNLNENTAAKIGKQNRENVSSILETALQQDKKTSAYKIAEKLNKKGNTNSITDAELGKLVFANELAEKENLIKQYKDDPETLNALIEEGKASGKKSVAAKLANKIENKIKQGKEVTVQDVEKLIVANDVYINEENRVSNITNSNTETNKAAGYGRYGTEAFNSLLESNTEGRDTNSIRNEFQQAYELGRLDTPSDKVNFDAYPIREAAFLAGKKDYILETTQEQKASQFATVYGKEAGLIENDYVKNYDSGTTSFLNAIAKATGTKAMLVEEVSANSAAQASMNSDGILEISIHAQDPIFELTKHEITHRMQQLAPTEYNAYKNYALQLLASERGQSATTLVEDYQAYAKNKNVYLSTSEAMDEIAADYTGQILKDQKALEQFVEEMSQTKEKRTVAQKFFDAVREFINKIKKVFKGNKSKMDAAAQEQFGATVSELEHAEKLWKDALAASIKRAQEVNKKRTDNRLQSLGLQSPPLEHRNGSIRKIAQSDKNVKTQLETTSNGVKYSLGMSFAEQVDAVFDRSLPVNTAVYVMDTPEILQALGLKEYPMLMTQKHIRDINHAKSDNHSEYHGISKKIINKIPSMINNPTMILNSANHKGDIVIVTSELDPDGLPIIIAINPNGNGRYNNAEIASNFIKSMYGRTGFEGFVNRAIENNDVLYVNKKRIRSLYTSSRLQLPASLLRDGFFTENISQLNENVKTQFSLKKPIEETKNLIALHNLTENKLLKALDLGRFPMPSIAVTKTDIPHTNFGDITLVMNKSTIDPKASRKNTVYSADAWTPTFPRVEYDVNEETERTLYAKANEARSNIPKEYVDTVNRMAGSITDYLSNYETEEALINRFKDEYAIKALYLSDKGEKVNTQTKEINEEKKTNTKYDAVLGLFEEDIDTLRKMPLNEVHEKYAERIKKILIENGASEEYAEKMTSKDRTFGFWNFLSRVLDYARQPANTTKTETDYKAIERDIDSRVDEAEYNEWLTNIFSGVIRDTGIYNGKDFYTPSGNRRSFSATHYPVTLENIAKAMAAQGDGNSRNVSGFYGVKSLRAGTAERFKSIADMHKLESRLKHLTQEQAQAITDDLDARLSNILGRIYNKKKHGANDNQFIEYDTIGNILMEVTEQPKYTVDSIQKVFSKYGYQLGNQLATDIRDLLFDVNEMPVNIFEAKPERAVRFDEVMAAVVPNNTSDNLRGALRNVGVPVIEYNAGDEQSRIDAVNSVEGARFSLQGQSDILKENARLNEVVKDLKAEFKETTFAMTDKKSLEKLTRNILRDYDSTLEFDEAFNAINDLYAYIANGSSYVNDALLAEFDKNLKDLKTTKDENGNKIKVTRELVLDMLDTMQVNEAQESTLLERAGFKGYDRSVSTVDFEEIYSRALEISQKIVSNALVVNDEMYEQYRDLREYLRTTAIRLDPYFRNESIGGYEDYNSFRKANFGRMKLTNDGVPVDVAYAELADRFPEFFDEGEHLASTDKLNYMAEVLDQLSPYEENPYSYEAREYANYLANDIIERFYELPQAKPTFADKQAQKITKERIKAGKQMEALREQKDARIKKLIEQGKERVKNAIERERNKKKESVAKVKEHYTEKEAKASDRRKVSILKKKINTHVSKISKMLLSPTETSHVPETMRYTVSEFLAALDLTTDKQKEKTLNRLNNLRNQYQKIVDGKHDVIMEVDPDLIDNIDEVITALGEDGTVALSALNARDLETLYRVTLAVERSIYSYNRAMNESIKETISELGEKAMTENKTAKSYQESSLAAQQWVRNLTGMDMLNPQDFFIQLGDTMHSLYDSIREGFDKKIRNTATAQEYMQNLLGDTKPEEWSGKKAKTQTFEVSNGQTITLTPAQTMSLYLLQKQPDALDHIYKGGIKQAPTVSLSGKSRLPKITRSYETVKVTPDDVSKIIGSLTDEQKRIADGVSKFFTQYTAEWGNEVSLALYGYKKFVLENYFPIVSDRNYIADVFGETQDGTLKNMGVTKSRIKGANNPIIIEDVFDVYTRQADQMSSYNAFVIPLSDIQRVFNYKTFDGSVKQAIEKKFGVGATQYFKKLMTDINGGAQFRGGNEIMSALISKYKQAKMGLNLRVIAQQPSAYFRAAAMLDSKYIAKAIPIRNTANIETIYKYAPIAQWKNWGYFSMDTGKQMRSLIMDEKQLSDYTMWAAGKMDELTWKTLWTATELEIRDKRSDLKQGSEEYYKAVGKRFSEIIDRTQVVDSTLHRSQILRNPDTAVKMASSFMSEPIKAYNLLRTAVLQAKENPTALTKQALKMAIGGYITSIVVNHLITAFIDTLRGDDDDEPWLEEVINKIIGGEEENKEKTWQHRYIWNFIDNLVNEPLSMIPFAKDIVSIFQGFDVKRMDAQGLSDLVNAGKRALSENYTIGFKIIDLTSKAADLFGIPVSNVRREISTATKTFLNTSDNVWLEYENAKLWNNIKSSKNKSKFIDILYKAYEAGDTEVYNTIVADMIKNGIEAKSIESGIRSRANKDGVTVDKLDEFALGAGIKATYDIEEEEEDKYDVNDLTGKQYNEYINVRGSLAEDIINDFQRNGFGSLDEETANGLLKAAYKYAEETALETASGGTYDSDTAWVNKAQAAEDLGLTASQYIMLMKEYGTASIGADGVYDAYAAGVDVETYLEFRKGLSELDEERKELRDAGEEPGERKPEVKELLDSMGLSQEDYDYLFGTEYKTSSGGFSSGGFGSGGFSSKGFGK